MPQKTEEKNIPTLNIGSISDIHYDEPQNFGESIHKGAYKKAIQITKEILEDTRRDPGDKGGTHLRNKEQICNIIFFTGDKGAGKTSSMLSYMEFLKDYYRNTTSGYYPEDFEQFLLSEKNENTYMFTGIDHIDASSLNDTEDILGDVLSKMLVKWKDEERSGLKPHTNGGIVQGDDYEYKKRQLRLQFSEMYERLKESRNKEDILKRDNDMYIEALESLSFSENVKKSFQKLVEKYLDIMVYPHVKGRKQIESHYLVISIDDLDMNVQSGFLLLEQIRKYLMVPQVIVLMSANYEQLEKICYNHYWREFREIEKSSENEQYIQKISREYLEKMIPFQRQVEMLSSRDWEYFSDNELIIYCPANSGASGKAVEMQGTLCGIVSKCMRKYLGVRFGEDRRCVGYLTPDTVREISSWVYQISGLEDMSDEEQIDLKGYENNLRWFWKKEFPRLCKKYLATNMQKVFRGLEILDPTEQVEKIHSVLKENEGNNRGHWMLLLGNAQKAYDVQMRDFSYFCMIYLNVKLAELISNIKKNGKVERARNSLMKYYSAMGWGVWGSWENQMITLRTKSDILWINIARSDFVKENNCFTWELGSKLDGRDKEYIKTYFEVNKEKIMIYQYYLLFYHIEVIGDGEIFSFDEKEGKFGSTEACSGVFSLSGFVLNVMEGAPLLKQFQTMLSKKFASLGIKAADQQELREKLFFTYVENELLLPIDNIDYLIYIGAQIQKELSNSVQWVADNDEILLYITRYFAIIKKCLYRYDKNMLKRFAAFGPVRKIKERNKDFIELLKKGILLHSTPYEISSKPNDWSEAGSNE